MTTNIMTGKANYLKQEIIIIWWWACWGWQWRWWEGWQGVSWGSFLVQKFPRLTEFLLWPKRSLCSITPTSADIVGYGMVVHTRNSSCNQCGTLCLRRSRPFKSQEDTPYCTAHSGPCSEFLLQPKRSLRSCTNIGGYSIEVHQILAPTKAESLHQAMRRLQAGFLQAVHHRVF